MRCRSVLAAAALPIASFLFAPPQASAQTGAGLLVKPFPTELTLDADGFAALHQRGHIKESGVDESIRITYYETEGRVRLNPGDIASPRIGYSFTYVDINTDFLGLPDQ